MKILLELMAEACVNVMYCGLEGSKEDKKKQGYIEDAVVSNVLL
jgi:hypothetical protein